MVHCDITPNNFLLTKDHRVKLTDFGLSKKSSTTLHYDILLTTLEEHFNNRPGDANVSRNDVESLKAKMIRFETRGTLIKLAFVSAD